MFVAMLRAQWIWSRSTMLFFLAAGFAAPLVSVTLADGGGSQWLSPSSIVDMGSSVGLLVAITVTMAATALVIQGWSADDRGRHVYALSLPIGRPRYLAYRLAGGFLMLALLAIFVAIGGAAAAGLLDLPASLRAYPVALAFRALLASWLVHAFVFLARYGAGRRAAFLVLATLLTLLLIIALGSAVAPGAIDALLIAWRALTDARGPLGILVSHWTFIDV